MKEAPKIPQGQDYLAVLTDQYGTILEVFAYTSWAERDKAIKASAKLAVLFDKRLYTMERVNCADHVEPCGICHRVNCPGHKLVIRKGRRVKA